MTRVPSQPQSLLFGHTRPKSAAEKRIVDHNNYWNRQVNQNWSSHNFFENGTVHAGRLDLWGGMPERPQSAVSSLVSTRGIIIPVEAAKEVKGLAEIELAERREELRKIIAQETGALSDQLRGHLITESTSTIRKRQLQLLRDKQQKIKSKKEADRKERASRLMYEQFKKNCPELREVETELLQDHVATVWKDQLEEKTVRQAEEDHKKKHDREQAQLEAQEHAEKLEQQKLKALAQKQAIAEALEIQLKELRQREAEKVRLTQEQERLMLDADIVRETQESQRQTAVLRKNKKYAKLLWRQWRAQLRQRAMERRKELENDLQILEKIETETARGLEAQETKRSALVESVRDNLRQTREKIRREKDLEFGLDLMVREQGEKVWEEREATWAAERAASEKLLDDVLQYRCEQISARQERNLAAQDELIKEREDLLAQIEHIASETARDQLQATEKREHLKTDREAEIAFYDQQKEEEDQVRELEEAQRQQAQKAYENTVAEERARILGETYIERVHPRPTTRPSTSQSVRFEEPPVRYSQSRPQTAASSRPRTADSGLTAISRVTGPFIY